MRTSILFAVLTVTGAICSTSARADYQASVAFAAKGEYEKAFTSCKEDAAKGDADCQGGLGYQYLLGLGVRKDDKEAEKWLRFAAEQGNLFAQDNLASLYYDRENHAESLKWARRAAEKNFAASQNRLGIMSGSGLGVPKDDVQAFKWYRLAANQGLAVAQSNLADYYGAGRGVEKDVKEAVKWYRLSANQGNATAQNRLGLAYQGGLGVEKDYDEAVKWYRLAAEQGDMWAESNLGYMYAMGWGVLKNYEESLKWNRRAAEKGNPVSQNALAVLYSNGWGVEKDPGESLKWRRLAANSGNGLALVGLGAAYGAGDGVKKDDVEALKWILLGEQHPDDFLPDQLENVKRARRDLQAKLSAKQLAEAERGVANWKPVTVTVAATPTAVAGQVAKPPAAVANVAVARPMPETVKTLSAFALVIGNSTYLGAPLPNPRNDAVAIAKQLTDFGIKVDLALNVDRKRFVQVLSDFAEKSANADLVILYYAGHGVQYNGTNYLIPVDLDLTKESTAAAFTLEALSLNLLLEQYLPAKTRLVFLDACRDNPLTRGLARTRGGGARGLAPISVGSGTLISYATKDGTAAMDGIGTNSPYAEELLKHLGDAVDINIVLRRVRSRVLEQTKSRQEPWEYGSLLGDELILATMIKK